MPRPPSDPPNPEETDVATSVLRDLRWLETRTDPALEDLVDVVSQFAGRARAALVLHDGPRRWCAARTVGVPSWWNLEGPGLPVAAKSPILIGDPGADEVEVGEVFVFGDARVDESRQRTLGVFADLAGRLLEERRTGTVARRGGWGAVVVRADGRLRAVSPMFAEMLGRDHRRIVGLPVFDLIDTDDHAMAIDSFANTAAYPGEKYPLDVRFVAADGSSVSLEVTAEGRDDSSDDDIVFVVREAGSRTDSDAFVSDQSRVLAMIGQGSALQDILGELARLVERHLRAAASIMLVDRADATLRTIAAAGTPREVQLALDGIAISDDGSTPARAAYRNQAARTADISDDPGWSAILPTIEAAGFRGCWSCPILITPPTNVSAGATPRGGAAIGVLSLFTPHGRAPSAEDVRLADLCARMAAVAVQRSTAEDALVHQAMHDPLTGLPNRALFLDRLAHAFARRPDERRFTAVMFLDLDRFKLINDALGHEIGDQVLVGIADRLQAVIRNSASVARFGGDEFTVLCENLRSIDDAASIARRLVDAVSTPLVIGDTGVSMTISIGISITNQIVTNPDGMIREADAAMYRAKERGRNRFEFFDAPMRADSHARLELEQSMRDSMERGDFTVAFQPIFDLHTDRLVGAEALLRWEHPERGTLLPDDFLAVAEETGLILQLGRWVLSTACHQAAAWAADTDGPFGRSDDFVVWVGIAAGQLHQPEFLLQIEELLEATGVAPSMIGLEVTERALAVAADGRTSPLVQASARGIRLAIGDFGAGHSSLASLRQIPADVVKIDRTLIEDIGIDVRGAAIVEAVTQLAHAVGCVVVAEGVETLAQLEAVRAFGCDQVQGFGRGVAHPPVPPSDGVDPRLLWPRTGPVVLR